MMSKRTIDLDISDPIALEIIKDGHRHRTACISRRGRKSSLGTLDSLIRAVNLGWPHRLLTVAPVYEQSMECLEHAMQYYDVLMDDYKAGDRCLYSKNGGRIFFRSADNPQNIRGKGYDHIHLVESAFIKDDTFHRSIRPTMSGSVNTTSFAESTIDNAGGWFYDRLCRGLDEPFPIKTDGGSFTYTPANQHEAFKSWIVPAYDSPYLDKDEIAELKSSMPVKIFNNEYLCVPMLTGGSVFEHYKIEKYDFNVKCNNPIFGLDVAKENDYTVMIGLKHDGEAYRVVLFKRMNKQEYTKQMAICGHFAKKYNGTVYIDHTGVGNAVSEMLAEHHDNIVDINFNANSKKQMVENLCIMLEKDQIIIPEECTDLLHELQVFTSKRTSAGNITYDAPSGQHDDCVMSLALAAWGINNGSGLYAEEIDY